MNGDIDSNLSASEIIDLERSQIGHDLHDTLLPLIFAASANLQPLLDERSPLDNSPESLAIRAKVDQSHQWLTEALAIGRNLLTQIYPAELDQMPWVLAAKDAVRRIVGDSCNVVWTVDDGSPVVDPNWDKSRAANAYRILIEAVKNACKHGKASDILIHCACSTMTIQDNGSGFDASEIPSDRFGIRAMKGRARLVGMSLTVESAKGGPTIVSVTF